MFSPRRAYPVLGILFLVGLTNYFDRLALGVLQVPIKVDLDLSDSQLGLLTGLAFFIPYTLLSIPMARIADRGNRAFLLAAALVIWSTMTALISLTQSFVLLLVLRMGVAIGESVCLPASYALLADHFPPERRARAIAIIGMSFPLGSMLGIAGAGAVAAALGWRGTFLVLGGLGLVLAPALLLVLRKSAVTSPVAAGPQQVPTLAAALRALWRERALRYMVIGLGLQSYMASALLSWGTPFYTRVHGLELADAALKLGIITGIGGALGSFLGGMLGDRIGRNDQRWYLWIPGLFAAAAVPAGLLQLLSPDPRVSLMFAFATMLLVTGFTPPLYAIAQTMVPPGMRALTSALMVMFSAVLGTAWGPTVTGALSDLLRQSFGLGEASLRFALLCGLVFPLAATYFFFRAGAALPPTPPGKSGVVA